MEFLLTFFAYALLSFVAAEEAKGGDSKDDSAAGYTILGISLPWIIGIIVLILIIGAVLGYLFKKKE